MAAEYTCGHCWRTMGDREGGYGSYDRVPLCHPDQSQDRPNCYRNVTVYGHPVLNCEYCKKNEAGPHDVAMQKLAELGPERFIEVLDFDHDYDWETDPWGMKEVLDAETEDHPGHEH